MATLTPERGSRILARDREGRPWLFYSDGHWRPVERERAELTRRIERALDRLDRAWRKR